MLRINKIRLMQEVLKDHKVKESENMANFSGSKMKIRYWLLDSLARIQKQNIIVQHLCF
ncbi:MAG: hypothetical protein JSV22_03870 [Bacteroidales bacterium]|nr:MAG: hypothetical protein JSV22_03870 [Bacteroidales bacterium]